MTLDPISHKRPSRLWRHQFTSGSPAVVMREGDMTLGDGSAWVVDDDDDADDGFPSEPYASVYAKQRAEELARRHAELAAGKAVTAREVSLALRRAAEAHARARRAQLALAAHHWRAVQFHERATAAGFGDFFEHEYAAVAYSEASENEYSEAAEASPFAR